MDTVLLPAFSGDSTLRSALNTMETQGVSGVVASGDQRLRLLSVDEVTKAINLGLNSIDEVASAPVLPEITLDDALVHQVDLAHPQRSLVQAQEMMQSLNALFAASRQSDPSGANVLVLTYHETLADALRMSPSIHYCSGPAHHIYTARNMPGNRICPVDGAKIA